MPRIEVKRTKYAEGYTSGELSVLNDFGKVLYKCQSLELPWIQNRKGISCVPPGIYPIKLEHSPAFGRDLWELKEVKGRDECKIHAANYVRQLKGCIAPGLSLLDMDGDGRLDATNSRKALEGIHAAMGSVKESTITIR